MDPVSAVVVALAFAGWLAWRAWDHYPEWEKAAKRHAEALRGWTPTSTAARWDAWAKKNPTAPLKKLWWAASAGARLGKRIRDAGARYQDRQRQKAPTIDGAAPDAAPDDAAPDQPDTGKPAGGDEWQPPDWEPIPATPQPEPGSGDQPDAPPKDPDTKRPEPSNPPQVPPAPAAPLPPAAPADAITAPETPPAARADDDTGPIHLGTIQQFLGDDMAGTLTPSGTAGTRATLSRLTSYAAAVSGLSQTLDVWKRLLTIVQADAQRTADLTRRTNALLAESNEVLERLRATHKILAALEASAYREQLEDAALARIHAAMEANAVALQRQTAAYNALLASAEAQNTAHTAQQRSLQVFVASFQYMVRIHGAKRDVELATGARSSRNFSTS